MSLKNVYVYKNQSIEKVSDGAFWHVPVPSQTQEHHSTIEGTPRASQGFEKHIVPITVQNSLKAQG